MNEYKKIKECFKRTGKMLKEFRKKKGLLLDGKSRKHRIWSCHGTKTTSIV